MLQPEHHQRYSLIQKSETDLTGVHRISYSSNQAIKDIYTRPRLRRKVHIKAKFFFYLCSIVFLKRYINCRPILYNKLKMHFLFRRKRKR